MPDPYASFAYAPAAYSYDYTPSQGSFYIQEQGKNTE
jgi:hypothetical protein